MSVVRSFMLVALMCIATSAAAVIETYEFSTESLEKRYHLLSSELRCPKCQNQNIADSNAPIAQDLRKLLHTQLEAGASDEEILEYMVSRYGEFVRYRPGFAGATAVLWFAPLLLLMAAAVVLFMSLRTKRLTAGPAASTLTDAEQRRVQAMLEKPESDS